MGPKLVKELNPFSNRRKEVVSANNQRHINDYKVTESNTKNDKSYDFFGIDNLLKDNNENFLQYKQSDSNIIRSRSRVINLSNKRNSYNRIHKMTPINQIIPIETEYKCISLGTKSSIKDLLKV